MTYHHNLLPNLLLYPVFIYVNPVFLFVKKNGTLYIAGPAQRVKKTGVPFLQCKGEHRMCYYIWWTSVFWEHVCCLRRIVLRQRKPKMTGKHRNYCSYKCLSSDKDYHLYCYISGPPDVSLRWKNNRRQTKPNCRFFDICKTL
jgi:hypothetical protein